MDIGTIIIIIVVGVLLILVFYAIGVYNNLINARNKAKDQFSQIDVQLKRRSDMIPNLVETVKGYAAHETGVFEKVTEARANALNAQGVEETAKAEGEFEGALKSLFAVAEAYPDLKANQNFAQLQQELVDTEDKIQAARRFYNGGVREYRIKLQTFPSNMVASMFKFKPAEFFELDADEAEKAEKPVDVKF